jgi:hypothetical protein
VAERKGVEAVPKPIEVGPEMATLRRFLPDVVTWEGTIHEGGMGPGTGTRRSVIAPSVVASYNRPDTGPGGLPRKRADVDQVGLRRERMPGVGTKGQVGRRTRQAVGVAVNGPKDADLEWDAIDWRADEDEVRRLRQRIFAATRAGDHKRVRSLQRACGRMPSRKCPSDRVNDRSRRRHSPRSEGLSHNPNQHHLLERCTQAQVDWAARLTIQLVPNRSTHMPNVSPQGAFSNGIVTVPPSLRRSQ